MASNKGAWLNQTKKVIKKASQVICRIFGRPVNERKFDLSVDVLMLVDAPDE